MVISAALGLSDKPLNALDFVVCAQAGILVYFYNIKGASSVGDQQYIPLRTEERPEN